jgi:NAD(P)-dependent dehydrogenase (short-subunit alcohol dehydrogenase family)
MPVRKVINLASVAAVMGVREQSLYCATKAAVAQMTRALALELAPFNVNVNAIAPGNTATPMNGRVRRGCCRACSRWCSVRLKKLTPLIGRSESRLCPVKRYSARTPVL